MVGSDNDECVLVLADLLQVFNGRTNGVVELEELPKCTVVIEDMHHLVCGASEPRFRYTKRWRDAPMEAASLMRYQPWSLSAFDRV
jgi:hypothetical protein